MDGEKTPPVATYKRDALFLSLAGIFLTSLVLGNVIGTTKFVTLFSVELSDWMLALVPELVRDNSIYTMSVPVGVIAYPFTFLATDLLSELYGRKKAQLVVWVGFWMNAFMLFLMTVNHWLPSTAGVSGGLQLFEGVYEFMIGNTIASMIAYLTAQTVDVRLFHFWKDLTDGKHLWLRNNASTTVSQLVDSTAILSILYFAGNLGQDINTIGKLAILIINSYLFKFFFALFDTPLCYLGVKIFQEFEEDPSGNSLYE
ncbi:queuosine precursor transporter [Fodinibius sp. SL11]|uniref:queuosine precursor transporter n=1 Tax=Fodinibius sp. SL11 TaxID=3425690 RepID=UPI003F882DAC